MKIGFIGLGNMATAMIGGIIQNELVPASDIVGSAHTTASVDKAVNAFGIVGKKGEDANKEVAKEADVLILAVKPLMYEAVLTEIKDVIKKDAILVSIAPGKTVEWISGLLDGTNVKSAEAKVVRCMPNTPALVGEGCTGVCFAESNSEKDKETVLGILNSFGKAYEVPERLMDAVVGVSGSSPAYVFMFIEAMADAAVLDGIPRSQAYEFAAQSVLGSAKMVLETGKHPGELKDMVCSPGGTTIEAVKILEEHGLRSAVMEAQHACVVKAKGGK